MFWFLKEVEKQTGKNIDRPRIEPVSRQTNSNTACEATVRELCNYMNNKTSGKYHSSVTSLFSKRKDFFCFSFKKDLQEMPLENWFFLHTIFLDNEAQTSQNNYRMTLFMSKQVSLPKISSILQKTKIHPKCQIRPFCPKPFNYDNDPTSIYTSCRITWQSGLS